MRRRPFWRCTKRLTLLGSTPLKTWYNNPRRIRTDLLSQRPNASMIR
ncbi:MAG: hypothetical protein ABSG14_02880 [Verrucomicrobiia bacterium]